MTVVNGFVGSVIDFAVGPFQNLPPVMGLAVVSLLTAIGMLLVFRATSNQARLLQVKRSIQACIYEVRLFNDDARAMLRAMGEMLRHNLVYLRLGLVPLLWMIVPLGFLVAHLQTYYGYDGLEPGTSALVKVRVAPSAPAVPELIVPAGVRLETPPVSIPSLKEVVWRIAVERPGSHELVITLGGHRITKNLTVSHAVVRRSPVRADAGISSQFLHPSEDPLPADAGVESIAITYPERSIRVFGMDVHWLIVFFGLSTVFAFALRRPFKVVL